jgi:Mrp family chromosome partitioning ATPase
MIRKGVIAVSSCKGGVGKSTVAVNFAASLQKQGHAVGLLDADIHGPSLPTMVSPEDTRIRFANGRESAIPLEYAGMKCQSFGWFKHLVSLPKSDGIFLRGSMVADVTKQLLLATEWGELDFLVIDMPPGTNDIQLEMCRIAADSMAAVIVTMPSKMCHVDVQKGIDLFQQVQTPVSCVALVENMSYMNIPLPVPGDGSNSLQDSLMLRAYPFGTSYVEEVREQMKTSNTNENSEIELFQLPLVCGLSQITDSGIPLALASLGNDHTATSSSSSSDSSSGSSGSSGSSDSRTSTIESYKGFSLQPNTNVQQQHYERYEQHISSPELMVQPQLIAQAEAFDEIARSVAAKVEGLQLPPLMLPQRRKEARVRDWLTLLDGVRMIQQKALDFK